jgi:hypothetical protein
VQVTGVFGDDAAVPIVIQPLGGAAPKKVFTEMVAETGLFMLSEHNQPPPKGTSPLGHKASMLNEPPEAFALLHT